MVESETSGLTEEEMLDAVKFGHEGFVPVIDMIKELAAECKKPDWVVEYKDIKFKRNLRSDVTVDGHCFSIWLGQYVPTTKTSSKIRGKRLRDQIKRDYILVTKYINEELETTYKPSDIQAITWVTHKRLNNV